MKYLFWVLVFSLWFWALAWYALTADSRQRCEAVTSIDTCQWELR